MPTNPLEALLHWADQRPDAVAVIADTGAATYGELAARVAAAAALFGEPGRRCALLLDNGADWIVADLAARMGSAVLVPLPGYFSDAQLAHALAAADVDLAITDDSARLERVDPGPWRRLGRNAGAAPFDRAAVLRFAGIRRQRRAALPPATRKLTFTSGTTGTPKGVGLSDRLIDGVARSLMQATHAGPGDRHLSLLPYAALLENIAGIDLPLRAGAIACAPSLATVGLDGSSSLDPARMAASLARFRPTTLVTVPQLLEMLMALATLGLWRPDGLRLVAVGGGRLAAGTIERARALGIPAYEGYGLSECGSVVCLNTAAADRPGSVGRVLPHCGLHIAADGEVLVEGALFDGYLGEGPPSLVDGSWPTGDIGRLDGDGFLYLTGRKGDMFVTAFGRNVAPEWVECELCADPAIAQAAVFGEARAWNAAVIVAAAAGSEGRRRVDATIARVNARLPDYARVRSWIPADAPFTPANGQLTANGRLRRREIDAAYAARIGALYAEENANVL